MRASPSSVSRPVTTNVVTGVTEKAELSASDIVAGDREIVGNAATKPANPSDKQLHWYRVTKGGFVGHDGMRARMPVGKELHDGAYNISQLRKQGIELEDLGEGPATGPVEPQVAAAG